MYCRFIKSSVTPKLRRVIVLALFNLECMKMYSVIDFLADINTS